MISYLIKAVVFIAVVLFVSNLLTGCGTIAGAGKDITSAADWSKEKMGSK